MPGYQQDEEALEHFNQFKRKISQNRLLIVSAVNLLTFALSIFSITYYKWVYIEFVNLQDIQINKQNKFWINLLYGKALQSESYQGFEDLKQQFCSISDAACQALFIQFRFVGFLSFFMFVVAYFLQVRDFYQVIMYIRASNKHTRQSIRYKSSLESKDSFMHIITILSYSLGLGLNFFSLTLMNLSTYSYGISFWMFFSSLMVFILCIIYKNISIRKIAQRSLMLNLIEGQKNLRKQQLMKQSQQSSASSDFQI